VLQPLESNGWRFVLAGVLIFIFFVLLIDFAHADGYTPLTIEQAKQYIQANPDGAAADIVKLDAIEHVAPSAPIPGELFTLVGRDLRWNWQGPLVVTLAGEPATVYHVDLVGGEQKNFSPPSEHASVVFWEVVAAVAFAGGAVLGHLVK
jgi:hypothetical protein